MFLLTSNDLAFVLHSNQEYTIGRLSGDIVIKDSSISRKHAQIKVTQNKAYLKDCNSKYFTRHNGKILSADEEILLHDGSEIKFGEKTFIFSKEGKIVTCATGLKEKEIEVLASIIEELGGTYLKEWNNTCTHLTTSEINITLKVLHAIMDDKKIVTPEYWKVYLENMKNKESTPNPLHYYPKLAETVVCSKYVEYNPDRKSIFKNKTFAFWKKKSQVRMEEIINKAGGKCVLLGKNISNENQLLKLMNECVVIHPEDDTIEQKYSNVLKTYRNSGKRLIPIQEIVLAIMSCSCKENCNPNFDRVQKVFSKETQKPLVSRVVVDETPSQQFDLESEDTVGVIPASLEMVNDVKLKNIAKSLNDPLPSTSRKSPEIFEETQIPAKKIRLDPDVETKQRTLPNTNEVTMNIPANTSKRSTSDTIETFAPPAKKFKEERVSSVKNPFALIALKSKARPGVSSNLDLSSNPFRLPKKEEPEESNKDVTDNVIIVDDESEDKSNLKQNESKVDHNDKHTDSKLSKRTKVEANTKKGKAFVESVPINFANLKLNISSGAWIDCSHKEDIKPTISSMNDDERSWCQRFNNSVIIVVKDLLSKTKNNQESFIDQSGNTGKANFKKFRKIPVPKSGVILKCTKSVFFGPNLK